MTILVIIDYAQPLPFAVTHTLIGNLIVSVPIVIAHRHNNILSHFNHTLLITQGIRVI